MMNRNQVIIVAIICMTIYFHHVNRIAGRLQWKNRRGIPGGNR